MSDWQASFRRTVGRPPLVRRRRFLVAEILAIHRRTRGRFETPSRRAERVHERLGAVSELNADDVEVIGTTCGDLIAALGYERLD